MLEFLGRIFEILLVFALVRAVLGILLRIIRGIGGPGNRQPAPRTQTTSADPDNPSAATLLHQDPVCGTYVAAGSSFRKISKGEVYHFCSEECRDKFAG